MYKYKKNIIIVLSFLISIFAAAIILFPNFFKEKEQKIKLPNDIRWVVKSDEYKMLVNQIYKNATQYILNNYKKSKHNAIVMDLDETILDNSLYQVENFYSGKTFNMESWAKWVEREEASLVPGSKEFIDSKNEEFNEIYNENKKVIDSIKFLKNGTAESIQNLGRTKTKSTV